MEPIGNEDFSRQLFLYLCQVIGSEKVVSVRRLFFRVMDDFLGTMDLPFTFITSGSKAEGLNMAGSDLDIMLVDKLTHVFHNTCDDDERIGLIADTEHAPPGFVYLRDNNLYKTASISFLEMFTLSEYGRVLSSKKFRAFYIRSYLEECGPGIEIHGPCMTVFSIDRLHCFKSQTWPAVAEQWFKRPHLYEWPPSSVVEMLAADGLHYAPIGSKFGVEESHPLLWRISFSVQEKLLVHSFNHTQLLCYALLKLVLKEIINAKSDVSNLLCSYFMKTTVFWMSEETEITEWNPSGLFRCFKSCIKRLIYWVRLEYCPNYFIADNNIFARKFCGKKKTDLLSVLENLYDKDIHFISELPSLINFAPGEDFCLDYKEHIDVDVALYPLIHLCSFLISVRKSDLLVLLTKIRNRRSNLIKSLYLQWLANVCVDLLCRMPYKWQCNNKDFYTQYKESRFYALIGRNVDTVSGWLMFASFLYQHGDYNGALAVTTLILPECSPDKCIMVDLCIPMEINLDVLLGRNLTFLKRHKLCCIQALYLLPETSSVFYISDLRCPCNERAIDASPIVYLHFLRFMCFNCLGNISERNRCITDIELTIDEDFLIGSVFKRICSYSYLSKTLNISKKNQNFQR